MTSASLYLWSPEKCHCGLVPGAGGQVGQTGRDFLPLTPLSWHGLSAASVPKSLGRAAGGGVVPWGLHGVQDTFTRYMKAKHEASSSEGSGS